MNNLIKYNCQFVADLIGKQSAGLWRYCPVPKTHRKMIVFVNGNYYVAKWASTGKPMLIESTETIVIFPHAVECWAYVNEVGE